MHSYPPPLPSPRLLLALVCALAWAVYSPGLSGAFLFDDFANLDALGHFGPLDNAASLLRYLSSGTADPLGRPLSLASFLLNADDWPNNPAGFLRLNLALHLVNGALLYALLKRLGEALDGPSLRGDLAALLASACWLLHPLFVSTTLYAVQREAMLPATWVLCGLLAYCAGRRRFQHSDGRSGTWLMVAGLVIGTLLGLLSKANGLLLPLLAWTVESTVFAGRARLSSAASRRLGKVKLLVMVLPSVLLIAYVANYLVSWNSVPGNRDWSIGERVMTEPRVLVDYLRLLFVPRSVSSGLFNDNYPVSTGWLQPLSTLFAAMAVVAMLALSLAVRRRYPALAAALLFFFAGHLLESSTIPLELYYEHRNYLPALLLFWPLARMLVAQAPLPWPRVTLALLIVAILAVTTYQRALLWGNAQQLAATWSATNPASSRAQATSAMAEANAGHVGKALRQLDAAWSKRPDDLQLGFAYVAVACSQSTFPPTLDSRLSATLRTAPGGLRFINPWMSRLIEDHASGQCPGLSLPLARSWLNAALENPRVAVPTFRNEEIEPVFALLSIHERDPDAALAHFNAALIARPSPDVAARQASQLAEANYFEQALAHLDQYESVKGRVARPAAGMRRLHAKLLDAQAYWPHEMTTLRTRIQERLDQSRPADDPARDKP